MSASPDHVKDVFLDALEIEPGDRAAFLDDACGGDDGFRQAVEALLAAHERAGSLMGSPSIDSKTAASANPAEAPLRAGTQIGAYRLVRPLGEGGFSNVFLADQERPVRRQVAVKIIKPGMDTAQVLARFEQERHTLALMDHPSIARIYDAGTTGEGRSYFVMEFVDGRPMTSWCDEHRLGVRQRLELFERTCRAVRHAHQKGVIHRDIKPGNVLVTTVDGRPEPKVIDFGIAKAVAPDAGAAGHAALTVEHQLLGTPQYMSPEQAAGDRLDIDTRTDIYSLGVLLYELLTGATPMDHASMQRAGLADIRRFLDEVVPPRPSTRLGTSLSPTSDQGTRIDGEPSGTDLHDVAAARRTDVATLRRHLRGDLDWIVMKALEKDRDRRYETADALATDVRRHLDGEPVLASPPSVTYVARKFVRRHMITTIAAAAVLLALCVGFVGAVSGAVRASRAADRAVSMNEFMRDVLMSAEPGRQGANVLLLDVIDEAAATVSGRFAGQPEQEAMARMLIGDVLLSQSQHRRAVEVLRPAWDMAVEHFGDHDARTLDIGYRLLSGYGRIGRISDLESIGPDLLDRLRLMRGDRAAETIDTRRIVANIHVRRGAWSEASRELRGVYGSADRWLGRNHAITISTLTDLALALKAPDELGEAIELLRDAVRRQEAVHGTDAVQTLEATAMLGRVLRDNGDHEAAVDALERVLQASEEKLVPNHRIRTQAQMALAQSRYALGDHSGAAEPAILAVDGVRARSGDGHPTTMASMARAVPILLDGGHPEAGESYARILFKRFADIDTVEGSFAVTYGAYLARYLVRLDRLEEADGTLRTVEQYASAQAGRIQALLHLARAEIHVARSNPSAASTAFTRALEAAAADDHPDARSMETDIKRRRAAMLQGASPVRTSCDRA